MSTIDSIKDLIPLRTWRAIGSIFATPREGLVYVILFLIDRLIEFLSTSAIGRWPHRLFCCTGRTPTQPTGSRKD